jgi:hypothetical protein
MRAVESRCDPEAAVCESVRETVCTVRREVSSVLARQSSRRRQDSGVH